MILFIVVYVISLLFLYLIIETAVRNGINSSVIGEYLKKKNDEEEERKPDFDNDHHGA
ncbi:hypothetical protein [Pontibacillus sp. HMF3514]|uniref:hypothetical protein n=1 Tax=Pontibacillus sp. HMF3514 TaxID=2692425 RepID=UPI001F3AB545|nr:hypothetical protein [Pontibacillus sp. HMF3514]